MWKIGPSTYSPHTRSFSRFNKVQNRQSRKCGLYHQSTEITRLQRYGVEITKSWVDTCRRGWISRGLCSHKSNCKMNYTDENRISHLITSVDHLDDCLQREIPDYSLILCWTQGRKRGRVSTTSLLPAMLHWKRAHLEQALKFQPAEMHSSINLLVLTIHKITILGGIIWKINEK